MAGIARQSDPPGQYRGERCRMDRFPRCTHRPTKRVINLAERLTLRWRLDATAHLALQHHQLSRSAAFSASRRLFDLNGEANSARNKRSSATIVADVMRFSYAIKPDEVFGANRQVRETPRDTF